MEIKKITCEKCVKEDVCGIKQEIDDCYSMILDLDVKNPSKRSEIVVDISCSKFVGKDKIQLFRGGGTP